MTDEQRSLPEQVKELIVDHADDIHDLGVAYGVVRLAGIGDTPQEINDLVKTAMLELFDEGKIVFFRSSWNEGYSVDIDEIDQLDRSDIEMELGVGYGTIDPPGGVLFFTGIQPEAE